MATKANHGIANSPEPPPRPLPAKPPALVCAQRLQAVQQLATDTLSRIEQLVQNPSAFLDKESRLLPQEVADIRAYFSQKLQHAGNVLREIHSMFQLPTQLPDARELISTELMVLFVLIQSFRPERLPTSALNLDQETQNAIREKVESAGLDVINVRERLK